MSLAAAAVLIVRGVPTEHRPSKTSTATAVAVVMRWKLSTVVAMSAAMTDHNNTTPLPFSLEVGSPLSQLGGLGERCKLPSRVRAEPPAENEFSALWNSCQKATGGNHFEYAEVHVLQRNDQNLALAIIQYHLQTPAPLIHL